MKNGVGRVQHIFTLHFNNSTTVPQTIFNKRLIDSTPTHTACSGPIRIQIDSTFSSPPTKPLLGWKPPRMKFTPHMAASYFPGSQV